jgi:two-component system nitrate/nitrite response regulator NarL
VAAAGSAAGSAGPADGLDVVLGDDHPVFAEALARVLAGYGFRVRAVVRRVDDVVPAVLAHRPHICVVDRHFGGDGAGGNGGDGLTVLPAVRAASPTTRTVLLTADRDPDTARRALAAGADGYLCKTAGVSALVSVLLRVAAGEVVIDLPVPAGPPPEHADAHRLAGYLTPRERDTLAMIVDGLGTAAIAAGLGVSVATVRTYVQAVLTKLGVHSRLEAASFAVRHALFGSPR